MKKTVSEGLHEFFKKVVAHVFKNQHMEQKLSGVEYEASEEYLVSLLEKFLRDDEQILFEPLMQRLHKGFNFMRIRNIGDASLFTAGILHSRAIRSVVGLKHYTRVGESAYKILLLSLDENDNLSLVYRKFAEDLLPFVNILSEIGYEHVFCNKLDDIIFVWERYAKYGGKEDLDWLKGQGVTLLPEFYERRK